MRQSGLADLLKSLPEIVWVAQRGEHGHDPRVGEAFVETKPSITGDDITLGVVDFSIFPHLDYPDFPENTMAAAKKWAAGLGCPAYAIDDQTAIKVVDGTASCLGRALEVFWPLTPEVQRTRLRSLKPILGQCARPDIWSLAR
jgi:dipeptidase E